LEDDEKEIFNLSKKVNLFNNIGNNVLNDMAGFQNKSLENLSKIESLEEQIKTLDEEIDYTNNNINKLNFKIVEIKDSVESTKNVVELISEKIKDNNEILLKYLVYIYKR
jgi:peptidoglycan hydrolase CwlO-like protein